MFISQCMKKRVVSIAHTRTVGEAVETFDQHHIGVLPVVDEGNGLVGVVALRDLLDLIMPSFVRLIEDFDFVGDFGVLEDQQPALEVLQRPVTSVMEAPTSVPESCGLLRAFAIIHKHRLIDLPVVDDDNRLVGIASRVDIGRALLAGWRLNVAEDKLG